MIQNFSKYYHKKKKTPLKKGKKKSNCLYNHGFNCSKKYIGGSLDFFWVLFLSTKPFKCLIIIYTTYIFIPPNLRQKQTHMRRHNNFPNKHQVTRIKFNYEANVG